MAPVETVVQGEYVTAVGRANSQKALVWIHDTRSTPPNPTAVSRDDVTLTVVGFDEAVVSFHDTLTGAVVDEVEICHEPVPVPSFVGDIAAVLVFSSCPTDVVVHEMAPWAPDRFGALSGPFEEPPTGDIPHVTGEGCECRTSVNSDGVSWWVLLLFGMALTRRMRANLTPAHRKQDNCRHLPQCDK